MRRLTISALFALALALTATGQPPNQPKGKPADDKKAEKKPDPAAAAIAAALANDADVKMAQAKMQLAEAELAKARQTVTLRVVTLKAKIEHLKVDVARTEKQYLIVKNAFEKGSGSSADLYKPQAAYETATASLAIAETEWKLLTGGAGASGAAVNLVPGLRYEAVDQKYWLDAVKLHLAKESRAAVKGPVADRIRAGLDKPVKLAEKGQPVTFQAAIEAFKKAGIDIPLRLNAELEPLMSDGETLPVGAWLQLFLDSNPGSVMVVREYGILVTVKDFAPPDAVGVVEFWKQKPPAKEPKAETTTGKP